MRGALALVRASWLTALSYRMNMFFSVASLLVTVVPLYFISQAIQPVIAEAIRNQGEHYFGFLLVGMLTFSFLTVAVNAVPNAVRGGISTGTLEALLSTPTPWPTILVGLTGYQFLWTGVRGMVLVAAGVLLGADFAWGRVLPAVLILALIVLTYLSFGIVGAALELAFRTTGPLPQAVLVVSGLLGGVYYPTNVIPSWIEGLAAFVPLTYGLRALRRTVLEGWSLSEVAGDVLLLCLFLAGLLASSLFAFTRAMRYARQTGTLAQY